MSGLISYEPKILDFWQFLPAASITQYHTVVNYCLKKSNEFNSWQKTPRWDSWLNSTLTMTQQDSRVQVMQAEHLWRCRALSPIAAKSNGRANSAVIEKEASRSYVKTVPSLIFPYPLFFVLCYVFHCQFACSSHLYAAFKLKQCPMSILLFDQVTWIGLYNRTEVFDLAKWNKKHKSTESHWCECLCRLKFLASSLKELALFHFRNCQSSHTFWLINNLGLHIVRKKLSVL